MRTTPRIAIPREFMRASAAKPPPPTSDTGIYLFALCAREFGATFCQLLLASRLGGDVFYAGSLVTLYINVVFRRPMVNPFVLALAVWSAGDWKRANVMGYPGMIEAGTLARAAVGSLVLVADLGGALAAARLRADYGRTFGDEFVRNAAGGAGQLSLRVRDVGASCWSGDRFPGPDVRVGPGAHGPVRGRHHVQGRRDRVVGRQPSAQDAVFLAGAGREGAVIFLMHPRPSL